MSFRKQDKLFITYSHPDDSKQQANRRAVSSFVSKSYRPTSKKIVFEKSNYRAFELRPAPSTPSSSEIQALNCTPVPIASHRAHSASPLPTLADGDSLARPQLEKRPKSSNDLHDEVPDPVLEPGSLVDELTARLGAALGTTRSRYELLLKTALAHEECYHALITQVFSNVSTEGFHQPHWRTLYHRGETMKLLRQKIQSEASTSFDCAIFATSALLSVEYAHTDHPAWLLHKTALQHFVTSCGGFSGLCPDLKDEILRNEFFQQILVQSRLCSDNNASGSSLAFEDRDQLATPLAGPLPPVFAALVERRMLTATTLFLIQKIVVTFEQNEHSIPELWTDCATSDRELHGIDLFAIKNIVKTRDCGFIEHQVVLALLIFIFNLHNNTNIAFYLEILDQAATDMISIRCRGRLPPRKTILWTIANIASAATTSPWHLEIPLMDHILMKLAPSKDNEASLRRLLSRYYLYDTTDQELTATS